MWQDIEQGFPSLGTKSQNREKHMWSPACSIETNHRLETIPRAYKETTELALSTMVVPLFLSESLVLRTILWLQREMRHLFLPEEKWVLTRECDEVTPQKLSTTRFAFSAEWMTCLLEGKLDPGALFRCEKGEWRGKSTSLVLSLQRGVSWW